MHSKKFIAYRRLSILAIFNVQLISLTIIYPVVESNKSNVLVAFWGGSCWPTRLTDAISVRPGMNKKKFIGSLSDLIRLPLYVENRPLQQNESNPQMWVRLTLILLYTPHVTITLIFYHHYNYRGEQLCLSLYLKEH